MTFLHQFVSFLIWLTSASFLPIALAHQVLVSSCHSLHFVLNAVKGRLVSSCCSHTGPQQPWSWLGLKTGAGHSWPWLRTSQPVTLPCSASPLWRGAHLYPTHPLWAPHRQGGEQLLAEPTLSRAVHLCGHRGEMQQQGAPCPPQRHAQGCDRAVSTSPSMPPPPSTPTVPARGPGMC
jgi:hypothetical protein